MKRRVMVLSAFLVAVGIMGMPVISTADPGNGTGNGNHYGWVNGNHYGWVNGNGKGNDTNVPQPVPEPLTLILLSSGIAGMAVLKRKFK